MTEEKFAMLEARVKQLESFLGHSHPEDAAAAAAFREYPKQIGEHVVHSAEEEQALRK